MNPQEYRAFTDALCEKLTADPRVIALMAAGSMAAVSHPPDEWSDHDFWLAVEPEAVDWFVQHADWLPESDQVVLYFQEAAHGGLKALYRSGHLLEFAVSTREGLANARVNDYRLLIDRANLADDLARMYRVTEAEGLRVMNDTPGLLGQFLTNLLVGIWRCRRGEFISGRQLITVSSLHALLRLIAHHLPPEQPTALDNLDPLRRFEAAYPTTGAEINRILGLDLDSAALGLLNLADDLLCEAAVDYPTEAVTVVRGCMER